MAAHQSSRIVDCCSLLLFVAGHCRRSLLLVTVIGLCRWSLWSIMSQSLSPVNVTSPCHRILTLLAAFAGFYCYWSQSIVFAFTICHCHQLLLVGVVVSCWALSPHIFMVAAGCCHRSLLAAVDLCFYQSPARAAVGRCHVGSCHNCQLSSVFTQVALHAGSYDLSLSLIAAIARRRSHWL